MPSPTETHRQKGHRLTWSGQDFPSEAVEQLVGPWRRGCGGAGASPELEYVEFVDSLPHNASGKVLKHLLLQEDAHSHFVEE